MTDFDNFKASQEGWAIWTCYGSEHGIFKLCRCDEDAIFASDNEAWRHVVEQADSGSAYHKAALAYIRENEPIEWVNFASVHGQATTYANSAPMFDEQRRLIDDRGALILEDGWDGPGELYQFRHNHA
jgi:hypothetical protein